jgi:hypothetical protein
MRSIVMVGIIEVCTPPSPRPTTSRLLSLGNISRSSFSLARTRLDCKITFLPLSFSSLAGDTFSILLFHFVSPSTVMSYTGKVVVSFENLSSPPHPSLPFLDYYRQVYNYNIVYTYTVEEWEILHTPWAHCAYNRIVGSGVRYYKYSRTLGVQEQCTNIHTTTCFLQ